MYFILGIVFIFAAVYSAQESIWNGKSVLFMAVAAFDIQVALGQILGEKKKKSGEK